MNGRVHVITGPMFSGKTEALLRLVRRADIQGKNVMVFRPETDTRSQFVVSRSGVSFPGTYVKASESILDIAVAGELDVVAIDEAQFFDFQLTDVVFDLASAHRKEVLISGLDRTFRGTAFGPMAELLVEADEVTKLTAVCMYTGCRDDAPLTQRLIDGRPASIHTPTVLVGGIEDETYQARCRRHHVVL